MIHLEKVSSRNVWKLIALKVREDQKHFVAENTVSLVDAYVTVIEGGIALPFGIFCDDEAVGFVMIGYGDIPNEKNPSIAHGNYCLWRFMIDEKAQGKGYGREALRQVIDYIQSFPCGKAEAVFTSYNPENHNAAKLYRSFGFVENGDKDGDELIAVKALMNLEGQ